MRSNTDRYSHITYTIQITVLSEEVHNDLAIRVIFIELAESICNQNNTASGGLYSATHFRSVVRYL
jgi:hypothetical protein